jgi:ABC-type multidrug transport system ATPase subunit
VLSRGFSGLPQGHQLVAIKEAGKDETPFYDKASVNPEELTYPVEVSFSEKVCPARFHGKIEFRNVHFAYPTNPRSQVLRGVSLTVDPGKKVALVGSTGCGKSSIMGLLLRLYTPQQGEILVDGRAIEDYDVRYLRSRMVIVDQHTVLFRMSLRENLTYGTSRTKVDDAELQKFCEEACAWDFIQEKPDKLMTDITTGGSNLSGGQRQRVAIARAMIRKPDFILLDEATSALDVKNEKIVQEALDKLAKRGSALVIAHRLSTIRDSDAIAVIDRGVMRECGSHDELIKKGIEEEEECLEGKAAVPNGVSAPALIRQTSAERKRKRSSPAQGMERTGSWPQLTTAAPPAQAELGGPALQNGPLPVNGHGPKLQRAKSLPKMGEAGDGGKGSLFKLSDDVTYRSLWEASTKGAAEESLSLKQMKEKMEALQKELAALEKRSSTVKDHVAGALPETSDKLLSGEVKKCV